MATESDSVSSANHRFVLLVHVDREFVVEGALAMLFRPGDVDVLLPPLGWQVVHSAQAVPSRSCCCAASGLALGRLR